MHSLSYLDQLTDRVSVKWFLMAMLAGSVNAGGFLACHTFVTHLTGFATMFGASVAANDAINGFRILTVPLFFVLGAMIAGYLVDAPLARGKAAKYGLVMKVVATLLLITAVAGKYRAFGIFGARLEISHDYVLVALLCLASGLTNAVITTATRSTLRATHLTGLTTDLAIGIMRAMFGFDDPNLRRRERRRNFMRGSIIFFFVIGSVVGAYAFTHFEYLGFCLSAGLALLVDGVGPTDSLKSQ